MVIKYMNHTFKQYCDIIGYNQFFFSAPSMSLTITEKGLVMTINNITVSAMGKEVIDTLKILQSSEQEKYIELEFIYKDKIQKIEFFYTGLIKRNNDVKIEEAENNGKGEQEGT